MGEDGQAIDALGSVPPIGQPPLHSPGCPRLREHMRLMAAWGILPAILLDIAARRDNTPVGCHSNTKRLLQEAERTPGVRVGYRPGSMGRRPPAGTHSHRGRHRGRHMVSSIRPSMAPNTAPRTV